MPSEVQYFFEARQLKQKKNYLNWQESFHEWRVNNPELSDQFDALKAPINQDELYSYMKNLEIAQNKATRSQSSLCLQQLAQVVPSLMGGSADLSCSDNTFLKNYSAISAKDFSGRNIKYGVREFAMAAIATGLLLTKMFRPYVGTFLIFSDYMRNAIRLSGLMELPVMYQFTHDSIFLGEDGPTHQPVEQLASLRAMPNLSVCRPADETEVKAAWFHALTSNKPTAVVLTRQNIKSLEETSFDSALKGAYVLKDVANADVTFIATGSECSLAMDVSEALAKEGVTSRVVSMMSWELFDVQEKPYKQTVIGNAKLNVSIEAGTSFGWHKYVGSDGLTISVDTFGLSAKASDLKRVYGFNETAIVEKVKTSLSVLAHSFQ